MPLPADSEALRRRVGLLGISYSIARAKHPTRAWLATALPEVWTAHLDYVLGEQVYGFRIRAGDGDLRPVWSTAVSYELQIRKEAVRAILYDGLDFKAAMAAARKSTELRETHFVTPTIAAMVTGTAASSSRGGPSGSAGDGDRYAPYPVGKGKGKNKGKKGKGKAKGGNGPWHVTTPDGRPICFAYNSPVEKCKGNCGRVHCCQICLGSHPAHAHKDDKSGGDEKKQ